MILLAGAGRPIDEVLMEQLSVQLPDELLEESKGILNSLKKVFLSSCHCLNSFIMTIYTKV